MTNTASDQSTKRSSAPLLRPQQTLHEMPVEYRWEVTRRHPYYLQFWEKARSYRLGQIAEPHEQQLGKLAEIMLQAIGFTGEPLPPSSGPEALEMNQLSKGWLNGAVAPLTIRGMVAILMTDLPRESRQYVADLLLRSAQSSEDEPTGKYERVSELMGTENSILDQMFTAPIFSIDVNAPQRAIVEAVEHLVGEWKEKKGISERRRRDDLLPAYLDVWDLREGWTGHGYDIGQEHSFRRISERLSASGRTVANRYYTAFKLVSGHEYSFENWVKLFIVVKLATFSGNRSLARHRPLNATRQTGGVREVPESFMALDPETRNGGVIAGAVDPHTDVANVELMIDLCGLIKDQFNDNAIIRKLDLPETPDIRALIKYVRSRGADSISD